MTYYITIVHPYRIMEIKVVPTGKVDGDKAEGLVITPQANLSTVWFTKDQIIKV